MALEQNDIKKLQVNLSSIRKIAGWTAQDLGKKIGVTKQTISNLENQKTEITLTQYIAIRTVIDYEIENNKSNEMLQKVVHLLLDIPDEEIDAENHEKLSQIITTLAAASAGGAALAGLIPLSGSLFGTVLGLKIAHSPKTTLPSKAWLKRIME